MEVYAGFLEHTDHHVGRVIDALEDLGILDDTIVYYIIGDNGASAEGTLNGAFNEMANFNGMAALETPEFMLSQDGRARLAELLQPLRGRLGVGDGHARSSGPSRSPRTGAAPATARSCTGPTGSSEQGGLRSPVHPRHRRRADDPRGGRPARADDGQRRAAVARWRAPACSTRSTTPDAPERHELQYFEMFGNRGIYHKGWSAVTKHRTPWVMVGGELPPFDDDVWELYDGSQRLQPGPRPRRRAARASWPSCSGCG